MRAGWLKEQLRGFVVKRHLDHLAIRDKLERETSNDIVDQDKVGELTKQNVKALDDVAFSSGALTNFEHEPPSSNKDPLIPDDFQFSSTN